MSLREKSEKAFTSLQVYEYPTHDQLMEFKLDTAYCYVSSTYCNGLVNYIEKRQMYMIDRCLQDGELSSDMFNESLEKIRNTTPIEWAHTQIRNFCPDNVIVTGETENSYVFIWYDQDVSDCSIYRFSKSHFDNIEEFNECVKIWLQGDRRNYSVFLLREPSGWILF